MTTQTIESKELITQKESVEVIRKERYELNLLSKIILLSSMLFCLIITCFWADSYKSFLGWPMTISILIYLCLLNFIGLKQGIKPSLESYFWQINLIIIGLSTFSNTTNELIFFVFLLYFFILFYLPGCHFKTLLFKKTSSFFLLDVYNHFLQAFIKIEIITALYAYLLSFTNFSKLPKSSKAIMIGLLISLFMALMILPMLSNADATYIIEYFIETKLLVLFADVNFFNLVSFSFKIMLSTTFALFMALFLINISSGKKIHQMNMELSGYNFGKFKRLSPLTIFIIFMVLFLLYTIFIFLQVAYLFDSFIGKLPDDFIYSTYARKGFYELCCLTIINVSLILSNAFFMEKLESKVWNVIFKSCYVIISVITILLIIIAFSKMFLYMQVYQLTTKRVLVSVFLLYLAVVWLCFILKQFIVIDIARIVILLGAAILVILSVSHLNIWIEYYNSLPKEHKITTFYFRSSEDL
ncbi:DUF4153 domain-containing protein [Thorsellia kenyensis]|uniref:DUF4153 domain-containing protein n=1 Tax=Thorsellia kenyensis TaxID=1549888 RepID=A0ABV6CE49_9GAMM